MNLSSLARAVSKGGIAIPYPIRRWNSQTIAGALLRASADSSVRNVRHRDVGHAVAFVKFDPKQGLSG